MRIDEMPPRMPVVIKVFAGDHDPLMSGNNKITLQWASNREPDLVEYRVYRVDSRERAPGLQAMTLRHIEPVLAKDPATRPPMVTWTDTSVPALVTWYYCLVAVCEGENISQPSIPVAIRAYDQTLPTPAVPDVAWETRRGKLRARISWKSEYEILLQCRAAGRGPWIDLAKWRPPGSYSVKDPFADSSRSYDYRTWARNITGAMVKGVSVRLAAAHKVE